MAGSCPLQSMTRLCIPAIVWVDPNISFPFTIKLVSKRIRQRKRKKFRNGSIPRSVALIDIMFRPSLTL